jgi:hypothetical protein
MKRSLSQSESMDLINNWIRDALPIKLVLFGRSPATTLVLRGEAWPLEEPRVALRLGDEGVFEFFLSLREATFELEDSADAPEDLRKEAMGRHLRCLTCKLLETDTIIYLYELWAA